MNEFEINQFKEAFADNHEINIPGFQRCMVDKEKARGQAKPVGATKPQRFGVLLVIRWESPHDYLILDDPRHYEQWYSFTDILLNDGCKFQVLDIDDQIYKGPNPDGNPNADNVTLKSYVITLKHTKQF